MIPSNAIRSVHVVSDQIGATQAISFRNPLADALDVTFADCSRGAGLPQLLPANIPDVLVLSRLTSGLGRPLIDWARDREVPVVFHIDDDLLDVPEALGKAKTARYRDPALLRDLRINLDASDIVYASTAPLAERLRGHGIATPVVAGEIYCSVNPVRIEPSLPSALPVMGYMGTAGNVADLDLVLPAIIRLLEEVPSLQFELFGTIPMPPALERFAGRVRHHPPLSDYDMFLHRLRTLGWWVGIAPLVDHPFNRCKADTKWVEYTLAGVAVVAQDQQVYHRACSDGAGRLAAKVEDWSTEIRALLSHRAAREATIAAARAKLGTTYTHKVLREQILGVFAQAQTARRAMRRTG